MLRDIERKVLRILWNFQAGRRRIPSFNELGIKTGRQEGELRFILKQLAENGYIDWDGLNTETVQIVKGWEEKAGTPEAISAAITAPDTFASLIAVGIIGMIAVQVIINIGVVIGMFPVTGITLPFISAGGSSLTLMLTSVGILLNISRYSR